MGIAEDALQVAVGTKSWEREQGGESLDMLHGSSWSQTARSLPHLLAKIREPAEQAQPQAGCGIGEEDALSFTHSNLHRAKRKDCLFGEDSFTSCQKEAS
jgi:hypothetical protein